jgi:hypothetical protein
MPLSISLWISPGTRVNFYLGFALYVYEEKRCLTTARNIIHISNPVPPTNITTILNVQLRILALTEVED